METVLLAQDRPGRAASVRNSFRFGRFELRADERVLLGDGAPLRLGGRAFDILLALVERRERLVEIDELLDLVWPGLAVEENNLSVQISTLRKLLGDGAITTVRGRGYRFTAPVAPPQLLPAAPAPAPASQPTISVLRPQVALVAGRLDRLQLPTGATDDSGAALALLRALPDPAARVHRMAGASFVLVFPHVRTAVAWALKAQRWLAAQAGVLHGGFGIALADAREPAAEAERALGLVALAANGEVLVGPEVMAELVPGLDAEVDDLGDLGPDGGMSRAYRLGPAAGMAPLDDALAHAQGGYRPSIAVLPFESLLGQDGDDLLGEALADEVIAGLAHIPDVCVVSGMSSRRLKRCGLTLTGQADCLSAHYLLTGVYRQQGGGLVLQVQFQEVRSGAILRAQQFSTTLATAFDPASSVGQQIAQDVGQAVFRHAIERSRSAALPGLDNYALLLGSIGLMHQNLGREFERARAMLAYLAARPGCAGIAAAWQAKWHVLRVAQGWSPDPMADARSALDLVHRSLDEGSRNALALAIGGLVHAYLLKDLDTAGHMYEEAIDANPSEPLARLFSATRHAYLGHGAEAEQGGEQALRLSPIDPLKSFLDSLAATAVLSNGRWDRSVQLCRQSIRSNRNHASSWRTLVIALAMSDRMEEARHAAQQLRQIEPGLTVALFRDRFPGRDGPVAEPWARALQLAGLPA
ncbi:winged helix-turn-helix domain-containing protein [Pseudorhodoferax sp. Leaf274]|uniref:winged helix-turn-helix domain-containing protein n=1 Tax=Pseudorhodoferax sp. Leaf274 TaxID=1736318 RepID=UPI00138F3E79|nr:winged helix-turn-helix domain-containing protein [Pseudorhodoferax sp. Leaf274]